MEEQKSVDPQNPSTTASPQEHKRTTSEHQHKVDNATLRQSTIEGREMLQAVAPLIDHATFGGNLIFIPERRVNYSSDLGPPPVPRDAVARQDIHRLREVFIKPPGYPKAFQALTKNHLIFLQGPPKIGKRSAAIYMLSTDLPQAPVEIDELPIETDLLDRFKTEKIVADKAYLLDGLPSTRAEKLRGNDWKAIADRLERAGCFLVVCMTSDVHLPTELRSRFRHELAPLLGMSRILVERHLQYTLDQDNSGISTEVIDGCLDNTRVKNLLDENILPESAAQLADLLAQYLQDRCSLDDALNQYEGCAEVIVHEWFDESGESLEERAFRIALAVFDGARYSAVEAAANDLTIRLKPQEPSEDEEKSKNTPLSAPTKSLFTRQRSHRLESARARLEKSHIATEYSDHAVVEVVKLPHENYKKALLKYLWNEYDDFRDFFIGWLHDCARARTADIRHRAAAAVGVLAIQDFERIRAWLLVPWAYKHDEDHDLGRIYRAGLSTAMLIMVQDAHTTDYVLGLLRYWSERKKDQALMWAAARAYGAVGLVFPREAMERWRAIIETADANLYMDFSNLTFIGTGMVISLIDAIVSLFTSAFELAERFHMLYGQLLEALRDWVIADENPESHSQLGLPLFLLMMSIPMPDEEQSPEIEKRPPALLALLDPKNERSPALEHLVWLLRKVLNEKKSRDIALRLLHNWIWYVDSDLLLQPALERLFKSFLAASDLRDRERDRLAVYLRRWSESPRQPLSEAGKLLSSLGLS